MYSLYYEGRYNIYVLHILVNKKYLRLLLHFINLTRKICISGFEIGVISHSQRLSPLAACGIRISHLASNDTQKGPNKMEIVFIDEGREEEYIFKFMAR